jgi:hypothetical protein
MRILALSSCARHGSRGLTDTDDADADYVPVIESDIEEEEVSIVDDAPVAVKKGVNRKRGRPRTILRVGAPTKQAPHEKASSSNSNVNATMYLLEAKKKLQLKSIQTDLKFSLAASKPFISWVTYIGSRKTLWNMAQRLNRRTSTRCKVQSQSWSAIIVRK